MNVDVKILIVEDEVLIADYIKEILEDNHFSNIKMAHDYNVALQLMEQFNPDVILLDINLNGANSGIELSKLKNTNAQVIFLTGQFDKALMSKALQTNPESYLTKPIKKSDLLAAIQLVSIKKEATTFEFKDGYSTIKLQYVKVLYFQSEGNYLNIYTKNRKYIIRQTLSSVLEELPSHIFQQTHRAYAVNCKKITKKTSNSIFVEEIKIPLSRKYSNNF